MTLEEAVKAELAKGHHVNIAQAERFWQAATAAERERCAKIAETMESEWWRQYKDPKNRFAADMHTQGKSDGAGVVAAAIRAGEEPK